MKHVILFFPADAYGTKEPQFISIDKQGHHAIESCVTALQYYSRLRSTDSLQTWDGVTIARLQRQMTSIHLDEIKSEDVGPLVDFSMLSKELRERDGATPACVSMELDDSSRSQVEYVTTMEEDVLDGKEHDEIILQIQ